MIKKRFTVKLKHSNPLFEEWLIEWRDKAIETNSKMQHCYGKALQSLQKYPLRLLSGKDCIILQGFGEKLCKMLDEKLEEHNRLNPSSINCDQTEQDHAGVPNKTQLHRTIKPKEYIPVLRSGSWAILLTLYKKSLEPGFPGFLLKPEIIKHGQTLCEKSFIKPDPGSFYTAWSSMKTLIDKDLVTREGSPAKYYLTDSGALLAYKLYRNHLNNDNDLSENNNDVQVSHVIDPPDKSSSKKKIKAVKNKKKTGSSSTLSSSSQELDNLSQGSSTTSNANSLQEKTFICAPYSFDIILLVDNIEVKGNRHPLDDVTLAELTKLNVTYEVRHLKVGDYTWICRERDTNRELVLPYIVERKRMDDFGGSIKDGRFYEQKFRLKQCGIKNIIYLIESFGNNIHTGLPLATLEQASINTLIHDGFTVKFTESTKATITYFATMSNILKNLYEHKNLVSCPKQDLSQSINDDDLVPLMTFREFNMGASKNKDLKVQNMFIRMLLQLKGLSVERALAIVEKYPTPQLLRLAYSENTNIVNEKLLSNLEYGKLRKKIGPVISKTIYQLFTNVTY